MIKWSRTSRLSIKNSLSLTFRVDIRETRIAAAGAERKAAEEELAKAEAQAKKILSKDQHMVRAFKVDEFVQS